jgi:hypothetical protein
MKEKETNIMKQSEYDADIEYRDIVMKDTAQTLRLYREFIREKGLEEEFKQFNIILDRTQKKI